VVFAAQYTARCSSGPNGSYPSGSHRGRYHTGRQPGAASQNTAMCPAGIAPAGPAANCKWRRWPGARSSMRAGAGALACCGWVGLAALARAVIINAPGKCAGFLQQLSSGRSDSPLIVMRWLFPVPRERTTGAIATSHKGASSAIPSFPEPTGRLRAAAHTGAGTTPAGSPAPCCRTPPSAQPSPWPAPAPPKRAGAKGSPAPARAWPRKTSPPSSDSGSCPAIPTSPASESGATACVTQLLPQASTGPVARSAGRACLSASAGVPVRAPRR
jgi:hypothetical protein